MAIGNRQNPAYTTLFKLNASARSYSVRQQQTMMHYAVMTDDIIALNETPAQEVQLRSIRYPFRPTNAVRPR